MTHTEYEKLLKSKQHSRVATIRLHKQYSGLGEGLNDARLFVNLFWDFENDTLRIDEYMRALRDPNYYKYKSIINIDKVVLLDMIKSNYYMSEGEDKEVFFINVGKSLFQFVDKPSYGD